MQEAMQAVLNEVRAAALRPVCLRVSAYVFVSLCTFLLGCVYSHSPHRLYVPPFPIVAQVKSIRTNTVTNKNFREGLKTKADSSEVQRFVNYHLFADDFFEI